MIFFKPPPPPPPLKGAFIQIILLFTGKKTCLYPVWAFDEDIVEAGPSFNLIDEENDDKELEIL